MTLSSPDATFNTISEASTTPTRSYAEFQSTPSDAPENRRKEPKVSRACDSCKTKKIRCSGTLPCSTCARRKLSCTYIAKYGRGRPPTPPHLTPKENPDGQEAAPHTFDGATIRARSSSTAQLPDSAHPALNPTDSGSTPRATSELVIEGQFFDQSSGLTFLHRARKKLSAQNNNPVSQGSNEAERNQLLASAGDRPYHLENARQDVLPDDAATRRLVVFYFDNCVVTYRMLHRQAIESWLETMLTDRAHGCPINLTLSNSRAAIILTILAIASLRSGKLQGSTVNEIELIALRESDPYFCAAMQFTDTEIGFPRLESAQARLIQVLYLLQTARMNRAWYTFGNACQVISSLGLHRRQHRQQDASLAVQSDYIAHQCAKRVFWTSYIIDKYLSVVFGRPRLLHDDEIDQDFPDTVNDEDMGNDGPLSTEANEESHMVALISHSRVARIIGQISREVYSVGGSQNPSRAASAHHFVRELHDWHSGLPPHLGTVKPSTLMPAFRREATALSLAYYHALIHATRPFLLGDGSHSGNESEVQDRITECLSAARKALELVSNMANDSHLFHSFWWTQYVLFCALAVVYVWEIQQNAHNSNHHVQEPYTSLYELAERCRSRFLQGGTSAPPSHRYGIILEELRLEVQQQASRSAHLSSISAQSRDPYNNPELPSDYLNGPDQLGTLQALPSMLDGWQNTDWLDLDSSAFYPIFDTYNTSL
ncbi:fungal-specific transcription factor domain-containing protein [Aspergillus karnatakaensis]|uniref:Zn(II)2Cys6 transcription factor n=1 Tax=Aspergillus karnatakaensis TaxID=1810916 RepID=UPI003CCD65E9